MTVRGTLLASCLLLALAGCSSDSTQPIITIPLSSLTITPTGDTLQVGATRTFTVAAIDTGGNPVSPTLSFGSTNTLVARVNGAGTVTGEGEGTALIIVSSGGLSDTAFVLVLPLQTGWFTQDTPSLDQLRGVFFRPDGNSGWAVGSLGRILATSDAGSTWNIQTSSTANNLNAVWFTSDVEGWAAGDLGTVMHTTNAGATWFRETTTNVSDNLNDIVFTSRDTGYAVGGNGLILKTSDRGATWDVLRPTLSDLRGVSFAGSLDGWAVGDGGTIVGTHNRGNSWFIVQPAVTTQQLRSVWRQSLTAANAVGAAGNTPRTVAFADSAVWELQSAGASNLLFGVFFVSGATGYAVGSNAGVSAVLRTDDGGVVWTPQVTDAPNELKDVFFVDTYRGWAVGDQGTIIHTVTSGEP